MHRYVKCQFFSKFKRQTYFRCVIFVHEQTSTHAHDLGHVFFLCLKKLCEAFCLTWCVFYLHFGSTIPATCILLYLCGSSYFDAFLHNQSCNDCTAWNPLWSKKANAFSMTLSSSVEKHWLLEKYFAFPLKPELFSCCWWWPQWEGEDDGGDVCCFVACVEESLLCGGVVQSVLFKQKWERNEPGEIF